MLITTIFQRPPFELCTSEVNRMSLLVTIVVPTKSQWPPSIANINDTETIKFDEEEWLTRVRFRY